MIRFSFCLLSLAILVKDTATEKGFSLVFHNQHTVPSNLYVNSAIGKRVSVTDSPEYDGKIYNLVLYPSDEKSKSDKLATAVISTGPIRGVLTFRQAAPPIGPTNIKGTLIGLRPGSYELRIHRLGNMQDGCLRNGEVFDPYTIFAEWRWRVDRSLGEVGVFEADESGTANVDILDRFIKLVGPRAIIGRMVSVIPMQEDLQEVSLSDTNVGCGIIGYAN